MSTELKAKETVPRAEKAVTDKAALAELLAGLLAKKGEIREPSFKALLRISETRPEVLFPHWDYFAGLLVSKNTYLKYQAIYLIASLTIADTSKKFERIFDTYYELLDDKSVIPAAHAALNSGKIARAKPELRTRITDRLLRIDDTHHEPERRELIKSYVIEAFDEYVEAAEDEDKKLILEFVRGQVASTSPKTRTKAKDFLKKWEQTIGRTVEGA
ncbi:MAG TPA: hypothetical protein ENN68_02280 [Methanomicrobia archaeon]|mgnify:CR=1 FL=1|nr:hypothetical protein [Methanomicrobia archaeon]